MGITQAVVTAGVIQEGMPRSAARRVASRRVWLEAGVVRHDRVTPPRPIRSSAPDTDGFGS